MNASVIACSRGIRVSFAIVWCALASGVGARTTVAAPIDGGQVSGEPLGACCLLSQLPVMCLPDLTEAECNAAGGDLFSPGYDCFDGCNTCASNAACADGNSCTVDRCGLSPPLCRHATVGNGAGECCDPRRGIDVNGGGVTYVDDGDPCTLDLGCSLGGHQGTALHSPAPAGTVCDDEDGCTSRDVCDGAGHCAGSPISGCGGVPTTSDWGLTILGLLVLTSARIAFQAKHNAAC